MRCLLERFNYTTVRKYDTIVLRIGSSFLDYLLMMRLHIILNNVTATFRFCLSLRRTFITSQLRYLFAQRGTFMMALKIR